MLTHRDIHPWNLRARHGRPIVLDWEIAGMLDLASELGSTALSLSKGPGFDDADPAVFRSVLDGYVAGGGALPPPGSSWFVFMIGGGLGFTRRNIPPLPRLRFTQWRTPARIVRRAGQTIVRIICGWPTAGDVLHAHQRINAIV